MKKLLITGGAGFVGSSLALAIQAQRSDIEVLALDNLHRRGSELNVSRLTDAGITFVRGDVREKTDLEVSGSLIAIIDCAAEPSVLAGLNSSSEYVVGSNLVGTFNCLEIARQTGAGFIFLSTSRIYPYGAINALNYDETATRFSYSNDQRLDGASSAGISENFTLAGNRTLYGATKLSAELLIAEYSSLYNFPYIINRCGVLAGPWQMGKIDQGIVAFWIARHIYGGSLSYIGFDGSGRQMRDILHIQDLCDLIIAQLADIENQSGNTFNVGGGPAVSVSLRELTPLCRKATGKDLNVGSVPETRPGDIKAYISDCSRLNSAVSWAPKHGVEDIVEDTARWMSNNRALLAPIFTE